jgi:drug/metabolite transporter (DMT)-like permease
VQLSPERRARLLPYAMAAVAILVWSAGPAVTHIAVQGIDPTSVALLRTVLGAAILVPVALLLRLPLPKTRADWGWLVASMLSGFVGYTLLFTISVSMTATSHVALIVITAPIIAGMMTFVSERRLPAPTWWLGALIALIGEGVLIAVRTPGEASTATLEGDLVACLAALFLSAGYYSGAMVSRRIGVWASTAWAVGLGGVLMLPFLLARLDAATLTTLTTTGSGLAVAYLVVFVTIIGYTMWYGALGKGGVARVAPVQLLQPILSVIIGAAFLGEAITPPLLIALAAILVGVGIIRVSDSR